MHAGDSSAQASSRFLRALLTNPQADLAQAEAEWGRQVQDSLNRADRTGLALLLNLLEQAPFALAHSWQVKQAYYQGRQAEMERDFSQAGQFYQQGLVMVAGAEFADRVYWQAMLQVRLALVLTNKAQPDKAQALLESVQPVALQLGDDRLTAQFYYVSAMLAYFRGDLPGAIQLAVQALSATTTSGDVNSQANITNNLGIYHMTLGELEPARQMLEETIRLRQQTGTQRALGPTYINLGVLEYRQAHYQEAIENYTIALTIYQALSDRASCALVNGNIAANYQRLGQFATGLDYAQQAVRLYREVEDKPSLAWALALAASNSWGLDQPGSARQYLAEAEKLADEGGEDAEIAADLAETYLEIGRAQAAVAHDEAGYRKALQYYRQALDKYRNLDDPDGFVETFFELPGLLERLPNQPESLGQLYLKDWPYQAGINSATLRLYLPKMLDLAARLIQHGQTNPGLEVYRRAFELVAGSGWARQNPELLVVHFQKAAELATPAEAFAWLTQALALYRTGALGQGQFKKLQQQLDRLKKQLPRSQRASF